MQLRCNQIATLGRSQLIALRHDRYVYQILADSVNISRAKGGTPLKPRRPADVRHLVASATKR